MTFDLAVKGNLTRPAAPLYGAWMKKPAKTKDPIDPIRREIGERLQSAREKKELTQQDVATHFDVHKATVSAWETGAGVPNAVTLRSLSRLYGVRADALLFGTESTSEAAAFASEYEALNPREQRHFKGMWKTHLAEIRADADEEVDDEARGMPDPVGSLKQKARKMEDKK